MIEDLQGITADQFQREIVPASRPVVMRGLAADWPVVAAGRRSGAALAAYLARFDQGRPLGAMLGPPEIKGRFFYNDDLSGLNFGRRSVTLAEAFDLLLHAADEAEPPAFAVQSVQVRSNLPGFEAENAMPLLDPAVEPRVWIGNRAIVAAHHDPSENIGVVVAGRRRFTLFPPDQIANLYMGPLDRTPAGTMISMVDFDDPDLDRHPRFPEAMAAAEVAELEPGDALYIPFMWWHHVRSLDAVSMLVNYWWAPPAASADHPTDALLHAMLTIRDLPDAHRAAWRAHFEHYVFGGDAERTAHLPDNRLGILGPLDEKHHRAVKDAVRRGLDRE